MYAENGKQGHETSYTREGKHILIIKISYLKGRHLGDLGR